MFTTVRPITIDEVTSEFPKECSAYDNADLKKLIEHAEYLINFVTHGRLENQILYYSEVEQSEWFDHYVRMKIKAVCAQMEYWFYVGAETDLVAKYKSFIIGGNRQEYELTTISPRVYRILRMGGMMNAGVTL